MNKFISIETLRRSILASLVLAIRIWPLHSAYISTSCGLDCNELEPHTLLLEQTTAVSTEHVQK